MRSHDLASSRTITSKLLTAITAHRIPAVGFVNEGKLRGDGGVDAKRVELLRMWLDAGLDEPAVPAFVEKAAQP